MPGLSQLQKFNSDLLNLGDEVKIRSMRSEKPVTVPIPKDIPDEDDSEDFKYGMPSLSEEEQQQADAAAAEMERAASDFSDIFGEEKSEEESGEPGANVPETAVPDMSELISPADLSFDDLDLSEFETPKKKKEPEKPKEIPIEDLDLEALLAPKPKAPEPEEEKPSSQVQPSQTEETDLFNEFMSPSEDNAEDEDLGLPKEFLKAQNKGSTDQSAEDLPFLESEEPEKTEEPEPPAESGFDFTSADEDFEEENSSVIDMNDGIPDEFNEKPDEKPVVKPEIVQEQPQTQPLEEDFTLPDFDEDFNFQDETEPPEQSEQTEQPDLNAPDEENFDLPDFDVSDFSKDEVTSESEQEHQDFDTASEENFDLPDFDENFPSSDETEQTEQSEQNDFPAEEKSEEMDFSVPDFGFSDFAGTDSQGSESLGLPDFDETGSTETVQDNTPPEVGHDIGQELGEDFGNLKISDYEGKIPEKKQEPSPHASVPEDEPVETFDTSAMEGLDFSNSQSDFELGKVDAVESDDDFFTIPGFSDTVTADITKKKAPVAIEEDESGKPKNTFTDAEYQRFKKNLAQYPLNIRIALEDLVVKNEFTDDAVFGILEKVLRKVPARQIATELEKMMDISLEVPRDFERRTAEEYEAYKKSLEYQLKNKIIPGAVLSAAAAIMIFCIFTITNTFIYRPLKAASLYKTGYALLEENQYPQSEDMFNMALSYRSVKKWFFRYAQGYRDHKQYDRARMMYKAVLQRYNHDKKAGLEWADMEHSDLYNYEEAERIVKREVLDYSINDYDGILKLGDIYLDWATEKDDSKYKNALEQYNLLETNYGASNLSQSRKMRYFIRTDNLREVLKYKEEFYPQKKALGAEDLTELSGYLLDKRYGKLRPAEESLRFYIEDVRDLLERALKADDTNPVALYNLGRYFEETGSDSLAVNLLERSIAAFENQNKRNRRETYKYINAYRLLGEEYRDSRNFIDAEETYAKGIDIFERERSSSGFESDENIGHLYSDLGDIDYFISLNNDDALVHYINAVENKYDTPSVRYKIGYINYNNKNYSAALGSFIESASHNPNDIHVLLSLGNTLTENGDINSAIGYYEDLMNKLNVERERQGVLLPQVRDDQFDLVDTYMKTSNNLGVALSRQAEKTGNSGLNASAIVNFQESIRAWDSLTRNQTTMIRLEGSNLAEQNVKYLTQPFSEYEPEIYTDIPRTLYGETIIK
ncbi:MAG: hypothetical protein SO116_01480 [Treponema sp.]|nr:hypothetical protein [Treponema sp.]